LSQSFCRRLKPFQHNEFIADKIQKGLKDKILLAILAHKMDKIKKVSQC
jgi:hypothetical protein